MKSINPRISKLRELMVMEEHRASLQSQLDDLVNKMSALKDALFDDYQPSSKAAAAPSVQASAPSPRRGRKRGRAPRGELKSQIVGALTSAGSSGLRVSDLARSLGMKPVNVHSWFHSAMRRYKQIKKVDRGVYRLDGSLDHAVSSPATASKPARATAKAGRKKGRAKNTPRSGRGELSQKIMAELTTAGAKGINVRDLAGKIGTPYKNIYIWFATTGKKNGQVKKIAPATYKLAA